MWISTDPALGDYIPKAPINEEAKKHNQNLPGMGGVFNHINGDLYAYAGNNPVRYIDPDGKSIYNRVNTRIARAIKTLYDKSETFKNIYRSLASGDNRQGNKLFVMIVDSSCKYAGNTQSQDCKIEAPASVVTYIKDDDYSVETLSPETDVQAIIINIDLDIVDSHNLNILNVVAEEFAHAEKASEVGTEKWNARASAENMLPYKERPEEIRAKNVVLKIMQEIKCNE